jgi:hypothetical protein
MHEHDFESAAAAVARRGVVHRRPAEAGASVQALVAGERTAYTPAGILHLQRLAGNSGVNELLEQDRPSPVREVVGSSGGSPLESNARSFLEGRLSADFSDVRIHTGPKADESARSISAQAYTVGSDVVFRSGAYQPDTPAGRHMLAHELTHVIQQRSGPVDGTPAPGGISISHPSDSFEQAASRSADQAMAGEVASAPVPAGAGSGVTAQRAGEEPEELEDDTGGAPAAQRAADGEEEETSDE